MTDDDPWRIARRAWQLAPTSCPPSCRGYHRLWPTVRLLGLGAGPDRHLDWFRRQLPSPGTAARRPRILVSGLADPAMFDLVRTITDGEQPEIVVLDRCPTPVALCQPESDEDDREPPAAGVVADVLDHTDPQGFDLITTHSFVSQMPAEGRSLLAVRWHDLLRPGGRIVTNTRLAPATRDTFEDDRTARLRGAVDERLAAIDPSLLPATRHELLDAVDAYAASVTIHPLGTTDEVRSLFEDAGLTVDLRVVRAGSTLPAGAGPGTAQTADYVELVATRPA